MVRFRWRWPLLLAAALVALVGVAVAAAQPPPGDPVKGEAVYNGSCALCHGAKGLGIVGPPLAGLAGHMERIAQLPGGMEGGLRRFETASPTGCRDSRQVSLVMRTWGT